MASSDSPSDPLPGSAAGDGLASEIGDATLQKLLSEDHGALLDRIDQLRVVGFDLPLPQIVVCGDQSSGKSSVLEAISRLSFPRGQGRCTTFPTELVLRRGHACGPQVKIEPAHNRNEAEKRALRQPLLSATDEVNFHNVFEKARARLQSFGAQSLYHKDVLRIEVHNPSWPPLTLVDLPGIIHSDPSEQEKGSVEKVQAIVRSYLEGPNTVILAVMSAANDPEIQQVLEMVKEVDPEGKRTLGIITKPDRIEGGTKGEERFVQYANNQERKLGLGWHVVKNLDSESHDRSLDDRDQEEKLFFRQGVWQSLKPEQLGIDRLRDRLSKVLMDITSLALPGILSKISSSLDECQKELNLLGAPRNSRQEQLAYISELSYKFDVILQQAKRGDYADNSFFEPGLELINARRLRAAIGKLNEDFVEAMYMRGHAYEIAPDPVYENEVNQHEESVQNKPTGEWKFWNPKYYDLRLPKRIYYTEYLDLVADLAHQNKGSELPGIPNSHLIGEMFRQYSEPWERIASLHIDTVWKVVNEALKLVANHVAPSETAKAIHRCLIEDKMQEMQRAIFRKLQELLKPYRNYHPMTYHPAFFRQIRNVKAEQLLVSDPSVSHKYLNIDGKTADFALTYMLAYYQVAIGTFIDNVVTLAVEQCLLEDITDIFNPVNVPKMNPEELERLASESQDVRSRRQTLLADEQQLNDALDIVSRSSNRRMLSDEPPLQHNPPPLRSKGKERTRENEDSVPAESGPAASSIPLPIITTSSSADISTSSSSDPGSKQDGWTKFLSTAKNPGRQVSTGLSSSDTASSGSNIFGSSQRTIPKDVRSRSANSSPAPSKDLTKSVSDSSSSAARSKDSATNVFNFNTLPQPIPERPLTTGGFGSSKPLGSSSLFSSTKPLSSTTLFGSSQPSGSAPLFGSFGSSKPAGSSGQFGSGGGFGFSSGFGPRPTALDSQSTFSKPSTGLFGSLSSGGFGSSSTASDSQFTPNKPSMGLFGSSSSSTSGTISAPSLFSSSLSTTSASQPSPFGEAPKAAEISRSQTNSPWSFQTSQSSKNKETLKTPSIFSGVGGVDKPSPTAPDPNIDTSYRRQGENVWCHYTENSTAHQDWGEDVYQCLWTRNIFQPASFEEVRFQYYIDNDIIRSNGTFVKGGR